MGAQKIFGEGGRNWGERREEREVWEKGERKIWQYSESINYPTHFPCFHPRGDSDQRLDLRSPAWQLRTTFTGEMEYTSISAKVQKPISSLRAATMIYSVNPGVCINLAPSHCSMFHECFKWHLPEGTLRSSCLSVPIKWGKGSDISFHRATADPRNAY